MDSLVHGVAESRTLLSDFYFQVIAFFSSKVFFKINLFIYVCSGSLLPWELFSSCGKWGLCFITVLELLIPVASLVVEHGL